VLCARSSHGLSGPEIYHEILFDMETKLLPR